MEKMARLIKMLSSKSVLDRKAAVMELKSELKCGNNLASLTLYYVSEHDPAYTIRNLARQAFYISGTNPPKSGEWERAYLFETSENIY